MLPTVHIDQGPRAGSEAGEAYAGTARKERYKPMRVIEVQRDDAGLPYRLLFDTRQVRGIERGLWERWPVRRAQEIDLSAWVERHTGPGSQLELFGEGEG